MKKSLLILISLFSGLVTQVGFNIKAADLKPFTEADTISRNISALFGKSFSVDNILKEPFASQERADWLSGLRKLSMYIDSTPKAKKDKDVYSAYKEVVNAANKIVDIQPALISAINEKDDSKIKELSDNVQSFIKSMTEVTDSYESASKKWTARFWSSQKKEAWKLMNTYAEFVKAAYQKIAKDLGKAQAA